MIKDKYKSFSELKEKEPKENYQVMYDLDNKNVLLICIHGGIESMTDRIVLDIYGSSIIGRLSYYAFICKQRHIDNKYALHVTSTNYDDPDLIEAVENTKKAVVSIHGFDEHTFGVPFEPVIYVGGGNDELVELMYKCLNKKDYKIKISKECDLPIMGRHQKNICNLGGRGVQLEMSSECRHLMATDRLEYDFIINGIRDFFDQVKKLP